MREVVQRLVQKIVGFSVKKSRKATSLSDNNAYNTFCLEACQDDTKFEDFRRNSTYNEILEHISEGDGAEYITHIIDDTDISRDMEIFMENDRYGNPRTFDYPVVGIFSPTTLRYIKVLADLKRLFGPLDDLNICEIGVGYGGQCRVVSSFYKLQSYNLVDINSALKLARRYLENFSCSSICTYQEMDELTTSSHDLVISNYAFTELKREIQDVYLEKIILPATRGYITYNDINPPEYRSYNKDELLAMIPESKIIDEMPLTHPGNCIIVWG